MGRGAVVAAVLAALCAGSATGLGLNAWHPDPLSLATGRNQVDAPSMGSKPSDPSARPTADPTPTSSGSPTGAPTGTAASSPSPSDGPSSSTPTSKKSTSPTPTHTASATPDPSFDRRALMRTTDFTAHGWATARVTASYPRLPDPPITPCTSIADDNPGLVVGYAGGWSSDHTEAEEVIARYVDVASATKEYSRLLVQIGDCTPSDLRTTGFARTAEASGVDAIRWYNTRGPDDSLGIIGVVRTADRLALFYLSSPDSDPDDTHPHGTTDISALLGIAGKRLH